MPRLYILSGPVSVGKSSFGDALLALTGGSRVSTRKYLQKLRRTPDDRKALQDAGDELDRETDGRWVAAAVDDFLASLPSTDVLLIDSARIAAQVDGLREKWGEDVYHIHLHAHDEELERRYLARPIEMREFATYEEVRENATEAHVGSLRAIADVVLDTDHVDPQTLAATALDLQYGQGPVVCQRLVDVIVGGQYGSEGKGNVCAHLADRYDVLMRIGGPNAGHMVKDPFYKYVQLPSGTGSNKNAKILIGAGSTLWLPQLLQEIQDWGLDGSRLSIDPQAMVIEEDDRTIEGTALGSISSTKQGVGSASARKISNRGKIPIFGPPVRLAKNIDELRSFVRDVRAELDHHFSAGHRVMLEGTQGTLLSIHHGFWPSVTSRETSAAGCLSDAGIAPHRVDKVILVVRTYPIRVGGTSGWIGREISLGDIADRSGIPLEEMRRVEKGTISGVERRVAEFDWVQLRRSAELNGATDIAITFADYMGIDNRQATSYGRLNQETRSFIERVERVARTPVTLISKEFAKDGVIEKGFQ